MTRDDGEPGSSTFEAFLSLEVDRPGFISAWLRARQIPAFDVPLAGRRHVVVRFGSEAYDPRFRMKTLVAHHDRVPGTPGANDNSAACFQLMLFASRLSSLSIAHNVRIIFTDGEEAAGVAGIAGQGSYAVGSALRSRGEDLGDVYVLDCSGRGDTLVLSESGPGTTRNRALARGMEELRDRARGLARESAAGRWVSLPTPYSDNAGFLASAIPSQVVTVLPGEEATALLAALAEKGAAQDSSRAAALRDRVARNKKTESGPEAEGYPRTWALMHTAEDAADTLTASAFRLVAGFLDTLARSREPS